MLTLDDKEYIRLVVRDEMQKLYHSLTTNGVMPAVREEARKQANEAVSEQVKNSVWKLIGVIFLASVVGGSSTEAVRFFVDSLAR